MLSHLQAIIRAVVLAAVVLVLIGTSTAAIADDAKRRPVGPVPTIIIDDDPPPVDDPASPCAWHLLTVAIVSVYYNDALGAPAVCARGPGVALDIVVIP